MDTLDTTQTRTLLTQIGFDPDCAPNSNQLADVLINIRDTISKIYNIDSDVFIRAPKSRAEGVQLHNVTIRHATYRSGIQFPAEERLNRCITEDIGLYTIENGLKQIK